MGMHDSMRQSKADNNNGTLAALLCGTGESNRKDSEVIALHNLNASDIPDYRDTRETTIAGRVRQQIHHQEHSHHHHHHNHTYHQQQTRGRRYLSCDSTSDGDPTSSDEYDMLANNGTVQRRVRCQYRVNAVRVLSSRRRVIRLLIVVMLTFAICVLPYHLKMVLFFWDYRLPDIISPLCYVMLYANSALNPILYWVFSEAFRKSFTDNCRRNCMLRSRFRHSR